MTGSHLLGALCGALLLCGAVQAGEAKRTYDIDHNRVYSDAYPKMGRSTRPAPSRNVLTTRKGTGNVLATGQFNARSGSSTVNSHATIYSNGSITATSRSYIPGIGSSTCRLSGSRFPCY